MRATILVIDSFGIGELPDAGDYGDKGSNTALHIAQAMEQESLWPALKNLGLGNASELLGNPLPGCEAIAAPSAKFGVMKEKSPGKDTTTGHWEMAGLVLEQAFTQFPKEYPSFPEDLVQAFIEKTGCGGILGNKAASGTAIIEELGAEHLKTGYPICYTSADSVFQIACHMSKYSIEELYKMCEIARELCDPLAVGRVIARPFDGPSDAFFRTKERHDYSIALPDDSLLDHLQKNGVKTVAVGKIGSIFNESGITESHHDSGNPACIDRTEEILSKPSEAKEFLFVNLVDTDMIFGHRRDVKGYGFAVSEIDTKLPRFLDMMADGDVMIITGDHGCDPSFKGTDHTREHIPLLWYQKGAEGGSVGIRESFSDITASLCDYFQVGSMEHGESFL
ncbi:MULTISPECIES: phosphopentomutase [unclassified Oceanispirochaeta]|uniref:phosphopentomutase n=1 Tax=unclassified Oceanispirochaeta TaxID=2635722 RepID=UPI000E093C0E|nr:MULTISPECIES: phosphopentomutase [unclassified Oceanispirochaeta]MBF9016057.1 phosphopentomutase [Oceanispirochaeta sp. M2]NPD72520.1 phosphopentomutase [Oceanispirochaeta sp. M1]RDG31978.1 phosphopentomutase [Oceanispirochaeta sp. M1]